MRRKRPDLNRIFYPFVPLSICTLLPLVYFYSESLDLLWLFFGFGAFLLFDNLGIQIGVHKLMSHMAFHASPLTTRILALLSIFSGQGSPLVWVAIHSGNHHKHYDGPKDIHSPIHGKFFAFIAWYWRCDTKQISFLPARVYLQDKFLVFIHTHHLLILMAYWAILAILGWKPLIYLGVLPATLSICLAGFVNAFMHSEGVVSDVFFLKYKNFKGDTTHNSWWLGLLTMGLGLHNNHHHHPSTTDYSVRWFEIDLSKFLIPLLETKDGKNDRGE